MSDNSTPLNSFALRRKCAARVPIMNLCKTQAVSGPLGDSRFRLLWFGQTLSYAGSAVFPVALTIALVKGIGSATDLGLVLASAAVGEGLFLLIGGVWADRLPRQKVMMAADATRAVAHVFLGVQIVSGQAGLTELMVASACVGAASGFFLPASSGLVASTVAPGLLQQANAFMAVSRRSAMLIGPAAATSIALTIGPGWAMVIDGGTFAVNVLTLSRLRIAHTAPQRDSFLTELRDGWVEVRERTWLWTNFLAHGLWNLSRTAYFTVGAATVITGLGGEVAWGLSLKVRQSVHSPERCSLCVSAPLIRWSWQTSAWPWARSRWHSSRWKPTRRSLQ